MGRPPPGVLFAQSFLHHRIGEHVDEVRFAEPVVISACELLESNVPSICSSISLKGVSSPQSFAVEFFIRSGGEARFRRLCPPFVYSPSTSTSIDAQAAVTDYLVLRGCYRAVTLIVYGNPVKDLGKFSPGSGGYTLCHDLDLATENFCKSEDLPAALCNLKDRSSSFLKLEFMHLMKRDVNDISAIRELLQLALTVWQQPLEEKCAVKISRAFLLAALFINTFQDNCVYFGGLDHFQSLQSSITGKGYEKKFKEVILEASEQLQELLEPLPEDMEEDSNAKLGDKQRQHMWKNGVEDETRVDFAIMEVIFKWLQVGGQERPRTLVQPENLLGALAAAQLLCFDKQGCLHFVLCGGTKLVLEFLRNDAGDVPGATPLALKVLDLASQNAFGCEVLLEWWQPELLFSCERQDPLEVGVYAILLRMLLQPQRHSIGSIVTRILYRLRVYELAATFQSIVEDLLEETIQFTTDASSPQHEKEALQTATITLKKLVKLLDIEDSLDEESFSNATQLLISFAEELISKLPPTTNHKVLQQMCCRDIDPILLSLLQERRFMPSLALLFLAPSIRENGVKLHGSIDFVITVQDLLLALLNCRSGLVFLAADPEAASSLVVGLCGMQDLNDMSSIPGHHATSIMSTEILFHPKDIGSLLQTSISVVSAFDHLFVTPRGSEASVWALWELVTLCRGETGKQAFLALTQFPEAFVAILEAIHTNVGLETTELGELRHAVSYLASELLHLILTDLGAYAMATWVPYATAIQRVLQASAKTTEEALAGHMSGINDKIILGPRCLELVEPAVVYQEWGAIGLLRYCAALVAGSQQIVSCLPSIEGTDSDNQMGDLTSLELPAISTLFGKGVVLGVSPLLVSDTTVMQLTIGLRILASISGNLGLATALYCEGAIVVLIAILEHGVNILHNSSDDMFDDEIPREGAFDDMPPESVSERLLVKLLLPALSLLLNLLHKLQLAIDQYRNTKLVEVLLRLNRCIGAKAFAYATVPPYSWAGGAFELFAVRRLLASVLICWPIFGWMPAILPRLLGIDHIGGAVLNVGPSMDPVEACSALSLLGEMLPMEQPLFCGSAILMQHAYKSLAMGTSFEVGITPEVDWHLQTYYMEKFQRALFPHLEQIAEMILHLAPTTCGVLRDMLKSLVVRVACRSASYAGILLRPILALLREHIAIGSAPSDSENFQVEHILQFISGLTSHPATKLVVMKEDVVELLHQALGLEAGLVSEKDLSDVEEHHFKSGRWKCVSRTFQALCDPEISCQPMTPLNRRLLEDCPRFQECCCIVSAILDLVEVLPLTKDILIVVELFGKMASHKLGRAAFAFVALKLNTRGQVEPAAGETSNDEEKIGTPQVDSKESPFDKDETKIKAPLLGLWKRLAAQLMIEKWNSPNLFEIVQRFALVAISLTAAGRSAYGLGALKILFGLDITADERENNAVSESVGLLSSVLSNLSNELERIPASTVTDADPFVPPSTAPLQVYAAVSSMLRLLNKPADFSQLSEKLEALVEEFNLSPPAEEVHTKELQSVMTAKPSISPVFARRFDVDFENDDVISQEAGEDPLHTESSSLLVWECFTIIPDRPITANASKRRLSLSGDTGNKRHRVDGIAAVAAESSSNTGAGSNPRVGPSSGTSAGASNRRDSFRQRKPNTSRPPSMHVDDYVARERGSDAPTAGNGNAAPGSVHRNSSSSGRPPSIHVDEFMARQLERQQSLGAMHTSSSSLHLLSSIAFDSAGAKGVEASSKLSKHESDRESNLGASAHSLQAMQSNTDQEGILTAPVPGSDAAGMLSLSAEDSSKLTQKEGLSTVKTHEHHMSLSLISSGPGSFIATNEEFDALCPGFDFLEKESLELNSRTDFESPAPKVPEESQQSIRSMAMRYQKSIANRGKLTDPAPTAKGSEGPVAPLLGKTSSPMLQMRTTLPSVAMPSQPLMGVEKPYLSTSLAPWISTHSGSETGSVLAKWTEETSNISYVSASMQGSAPHPPTSLGMILPSPPKEKQIPLMVSSPDFIMQPREHKAISESAMPQKLNHGNIFTPLAGDQRQLGAPLPLEPYENQRSSNAMAMQQTARGFPNEIRNDQMIRASLPPAPPLPPPLPPLPPPLPPPSVDSHLYRTDRPLPITSVPVPSVSISSVIHPPLSSGIIQPLPPEKSPGLIQTPVGFSTNSRLFEDSGPTAQGSIRQPHFPPLPPISSSPMIQSSIQTSTQMPLPASTVFPFAGSSIPLDSRPMYGLSSVPNLPPERASSFPFSLPSQNPSQLSFSLPASFIPPVPAGRPTTSYSSFPSTATIPQLQQQQHQLQSSSSVQQLQPQQFQQQHQQQSVQQVTPPSIIPSPQQQASKVDNVQSQFQQQQHHQILQPQEKFQLPQMVLHPQQLPQTLQVPSHHQQPPIQREQLHPPQQLQEQRPQEPGSSLHSLQQMLASPDAIHDLLKDQSKLRQLLEQHPKLISLLQEKLNQGSS